MIRFRNISLLGKEKMPTGNENQVNFRGNELRVEDIQNSNYTNKLQIVT